MDFFIFTKKMKYFILAKFHQRFGLLFLNEFLSVFWIPYMAAFSDFFNDVFLFLAKCMRIFFSNMPLIKVLIQVSMNFNKRLSIKV